MDLHNFHKLRDCDIDHSLMDSLHIKSLIEYILVRKFHKPCQRYKKNSEMGNLWSDESRNKNRFPIPQLWPVGQERQIELYNNFPVGQERQVGGFVRPISIAQEYGEIEQEDSKK